MLKVWCTIFAGLVVKYWMSLNLQIFLEHRKYAKFLHIVLSSAQWKLFAGNKEQREGYYFRWFKKIKKYNIEINNINQLCEWKPIESLLFEGDIIFLRWYTDIDLEKNIPRSTINILPHWSDENGTCFSFFFNFSDSFL